MKRIVLLMLAAALLIGCVLSGCAEKSDIHYDDSAVDYAALEPLALKTALLKKAVLTGGLNQKKISGQMQVKPEHGPFVVFLSWCDGETQADVACGTGESVEAAYDAAAGRIPADCGAVWLKADVVVTSEEVGRLAVEAEAASVSANYYRKGIAFDRNFDTALLEAEINSNAVLDYETGEVRLEALNTYLAAHDRACLDTVPETLISFTCKSWFCDADDTTAALYDDQWNYGRRESGTPDREETYDRICAASEYFLRQIREDGSFVYGYSAASGEKLPGYNSIRHAGAVWSLVLQYGIDRNEALPEAIERAIAYLEREYVVYDDSGAAYLRVSSSEIQLGGNAILILALTEYENVFGSDRYEALVQALGEGILRMMCGQENVFVHSLNYPQFDVREENVIIFYDGEAAFALAKLYGMDGDLRWLLAAETAMTAFAEADYAQYGDHWISYAANELTKYAPEEIYFELGLKNIQENLSTIRNRRGGSPTSEEMLMACFEMYDRIVENGFEVDYLEKFDQEKLADTIFYRMAYMKNSLCLPEITMYWQQPSAYDGGFFARSDAYRLRIDDVQHYIGGCISYYLNYDKLCRYADPAAAANEF